MLNWPLEQDLDVIHSWVNDHFVWTPDQEVWQMPEFWATEEELEQNAAKHGGIVRDDCDGHAALFVIACRKLRMPARFLTVAYPPIDSKWDYNHCVAESSGRVSDNRYPRLETRSGLEAAGYKFYSMSGFHPGDDWTRIK